MSADDDAAAAFWVEGVADVEEPKEFGPLFELAAAFIERPLDLLALPPGFGFFRFRRAPP